MKDVFNHFFIPKCPKVEFGLSGQNFALFSVSVHSDAVLMLNGLADVQLDEACSAATSAIVLRFYAV